MLNLWIIPLDVSSHEISDRSLGQGRRLRGPGRRSSLSYSLDANVLLYASDRSSGHHELARRFVETCAAGPEILCLTWPTLMAYLRIATHPRIFAAPLSPDEALGNVAALAGLPAACARSLRAAGLSGRLQTGRRRDAGARKPRPRRACRGDSFPARRPDALYARPRLSAIRFLKVRDPFA
jgi:predicted nucleic acid-binding protein